ncbi:MAG: type I-E CRISPR-associated protein Cse2/CasB [Myxococcota bacterium]
MTNQGTLVEACEEWWSGLTGRPGDRAALRRASSIDDALMVASTYRLGDMTRPFGLVSSRRVGLLAALLAQIREFDRGVGSLAESLGRSAGDRAQFSETRFRRLLKASDDDDLLRQLRRAIRILDDRVDLASLVEGVRFWSFDPDKRASLRSRWAYDYYSKAPAQPSI